MANYVIIKSFPNGITLFLDAEVDFTTILNEVAVKFKEASNFFKDASMALAIEGRELTHEQERVLINTITTNSRLHIMCIVGKDDRDNQAFVKALDQFDFPVGTPDETLQIYRGCLKDGQILETENSILILGDVYPKCSVISSGDIIIMGGLYGNVTAGQDRKLNHYVIALEMSPDKLYLGDYKLRNNEKNTKWSFKPKMNPKIAYIKDEKVVTEAISKDVLQRFYPI